MVRGPYDDDQNEDDAPTEYGADDIIDPSLADLRSASLDRLALHADRLRSVLKQRCADLDVAELPGHEGRAPPRRWFPFVKLFEVPLRDEVRDLLRDVEIRLGAEAGALSDAAVDELRGCTERDVLVVYLASVESTRAALEAQLMAAAERSHRAAARIVEERLALLVR